MSPSRIIEDDCNIDLVHKDKCSTVRKQQAQLWAHETYPPSTASIQTLNKIFLNDMTLESQHQGSYILVQLHPNENLRLGIGIGVDEIGNVVGVRMILQNGQQVYNEYLGDAKFLIIKEPLYIAYPESPAGYISIYHISDVVVLSSSDPRLPQKWKLQVDMTTDEWRLVGNKAVREKKFYNAINWFVKTLGKISSILSAKHWLL